MKNSVCLKRMLAILVFGCHALFAQTFYFLPPDNDLWIAGNSYIYDADKKTVELMQVDTACGWFKKTYTSRDAVPDSIMIYLGSQGADKLDMNGPRADAADPAWIPLKSQFTTLTTQYFYQDPNSEDLRFAFRNTKPTNLGEKAAGRCDYKMAAFIYDTDNSVNKSFSGTYTQLPAGQRSIQRGIVAPILDTTTRKPTFIAANGRSNWVNAESFNAAFTPEGVLDGKISNIARCYDMPFGRATNGTWEFDSDKMRTPDGSNLVGGYFPYILDSAYNDDGSRAEYAEKCPTCNKKYAVRCFQNPNTTMNNMTLTYKEVAYTGRDAFDRTYFADGAELGNYYGDVPAGCAVRPGPGNGGSSSAGTTNRANLSFCFESHAEFTYEKGQEFFFRGDDDIWIFINNRLVIDLGGVHSAAPGYVDLDTIGNGGVAEKLEAGKKYPIDIFFCERMANQSNVRVSTNMYITQKSTFYSDPAGTDNAMCAGIASGNDCASKMNGAGNSKREQFCGNALLSSNNGKYDVDFYMVNRSNGDTLYLSQPPAGSRSKRADCNGDSPNTFKCLAKDGVLPIDKSGITIDKAVYSCGGRYRCDGSPKSADNVNIPTGSWIVYARLTENGTPTNNKPLQIDKLKGPTDARIIWGKLVNAGDALFDAYGDTTKREQSVIAGKLIPIYVAVGNWEEEVTYSSFDEKELDPTEPAVKYSLSIDGVSREELDFYSISHDDTTMVTEWPRPIPTSGVDTVWIKGSYEMGDQTLEINLSGVDPASSKTPSLKLNIYQPRLRFTRTDSTLSFVNGLNPGSASGYLMWDTLPPFVGKSLPVYVTAWDTLNTKTRSVKLCSHCTFTLSQKSFVNTDGNKDGIVKGEPLRVENGRQTVYIKGQEIVEGKDYAQWHIAGPSKEFTFAKWDSLQFRGAPIPLPLSSELYDRNGDGIGDSLRITFGKPFKIANKIDSSLFPILVEVTWEQGYTVAFHHPDYTAENLKNGDYVRDNLYNDAFFKKNSAYWGKFLVDSNLIVISDSVTVFSKNITTAGYNSGKGKLSSYTPYYDQNQCISGTQCPNGFMWSKDGYDAEVLDRVPPIVVKAVYKVESEKKCGTSKDDSCRESIRVTLSEPIFAAPGSDKNNSLAIRNPFSYCFEYSQQPKSKCSEGKGIAESDRRSLKWDNLNWKTWELPQGEDVSYSSYYMPNNQAKPKDYYEDAVKGDDVVELIYYAYKINEDETTRMPKADDWVKIRPPSSKIDGTPIKDGFDVFYDAAGNTANPRERGVLITGKNRYEQDKVVIAGINKETTPEDPPFGGVFTDRGKICTVQGRRKVCADWMSDDAKKWADGHLYDTTKGSVVEFLPVPKGTTAKEAGGNFPSSVGAVFSGIKKDEIDDFLTNYCSENDCRDSLGRKLDIDNKENIANAISLYASVYYHTNLGNYTAHRDPVTANCSDRVFESSQPGSSAYLYGNNCLGNEYGFYLAWDLKTNKNRFVGTGAYVAVTKFYWQIRYREGPGGSLKSKKFDQHEFVELYGVYRTK